MDQHSEILHNLNLPNLTPQLVMHDVQDSTQFCASGSRATKSHNRGHDQHLEFIPICTPLTNLYLGISYPAAL